MLKLDLLKLHLEFLEDGEIFGMDVGEGNRRVHQILIDTLRYIISKDDLSEGKKDELE